MSWTADYAPDTKFRAAVRLKEELLKNAIITYLGTASDFTEADFTLILSPAITTPKHEERPTRFIGENKCWRRAPTFLLIRSRIATVPTIGDAIEALDSFCRDLAHVLLRIVDLSAELANKDHIRADNIQEVCSSTSSHPQPRCLTGDLDRTDLRPHPPRESRHAATTDPRQPRARVLAHQRQATCADHSE